MKSTKWRLFSFRSWFVIVSASVFLLTGMFAFFYFPQKLYDQLFFAARKEVQTITGIVASSAAPALYFDDSDALNEVIQVAASNSNLRFIVIANHIVPVVASYNLEQAVQLNYLSTDLDGLLSSDGGTLLYKSSIVLKNHSLGEVYIGYSLDEMMAEMDESRKTTAIISIGIFLVGLSLIYMFCHSATRSLNKMALAFQRVENGSFAEHAEGSSIEEINRCITSFNRMVDASQKFHNESQSANNTLALRLTERTKELQSEIQQRKEIEFALQENERRYRTLIDHSSDGIAIYTDDKFVFANPAIATLLRAPSMNKIIGRSLFDFIPQEKKEGFRERIVQVLYGSEQHLLEKYAVRRYDSTIMYAELSIIRLHFHGKPSLQVILRDLTQHLQDKPLRKISERGAGKVQAADDFGVLASGIAHDFANILSIIVTGVNKLLFLNTVTKETVANVAEHITKAANRGNALVKQLLTFGKGNEIKLENIQINAVILEIGRTLQQAFPQSISFDFRLSANVSPVMADSIQLHQVIVHLCRNARNAMPFGGKLVISTENVPLLSLLQKGVTIQGSEAVCIKVHAAGNVIKEELRRKIFEQVFQATEQVSRYGMGLDVVYGIMENHNGFVDVSTKGEEGATYSLYFPVNEEHSVLKN